MVVSRELLYKLTEWAGFRQRIQPPKIQAGVECCTKAAEIWFVNLTTVSNEFPLPRSRSLPASRTAGQNWGEQEIKILA